MSKSIESKLVMWVPDTQRRANGVLVLNVHKYRHDMHGALWYSRFALTSDASLAAVGSDEGSLLVYDVDRDGPPRRLHAPAFRSTVRQVAFSPNDTAVVACCDDGSIWCFTRKV